MDRNTLLNLESKLMVLQSDLEDLLKKPVHLEMRTVLNYMKDDVEYCLAKVSHELDEMVKVVLTKPPPVGGIHPVDVEFHIEQPPRDLSFEETEEEAQKFDEFLGNMGFKRKEEDDG